MKSAISIEPKGLLDRNRNSKVSSLDSSWCEEGEQSLWFTAIFITDIMNNSGLREQGFRSFDVEQEFGEINTFLGYPKVTEESRRIRIFPIYVPENYANYTV